MLWQWWHSVCTETSTWVVLQITPGEVTSRQAGQLCFLYFLYSWHWLEFPIFDSIIFFPPVCDGVPNAAVVCFRGAGNPRHLSSTYCSVEWSSYILTISVNSFCRIFHLSFLASSLKLINIPRFPLSQIILSWVKTLLFLTTAYVSPISWKSILPGSCLSSSLSLGLHRLQCPGFCSHKNTRVLTFASSRCSWLLTFSFYPTGPLRSINWVVHTLFHGTQLSGYLRHHLPPPPPHFLDSDYCFNSVFSSVGSWILFSCHSNLYHLLL